MGYSQNLSKQQLHDQRNFYMKAADQYQLVADDSHTADSERDNYLVKRAECFEKWGYYEKAAEQYDDIEGQASRAACCYERAKKFITAAQRWQSVADYKSDRDNKNAAAMEWTRCLKNFRDGKDLSKALSVALGNRGLMPDTV